MQERYLTLYRCTFDYMTNAERFIFAYIELFSRSGKECGASQQYIAERLHITEITVLRSTRSLASAGFIFVRRSGKRKERNAYTVNRAKLHEMLTAWKRANKDRPHKMPDALRIPESFIASFGANTKCLLVANLYQLQTAGQTKGGMLADGVQYSQQALSEQCGCTRPSMCSALRDLESAGIIESGESNMQWKKARRCYVLDLARIPQDGKAEPVAPQPVAFGADISGIDWDCEKPF